MRERTLFKWPADIAKLKESGQPLTQHNPIGPTIDGVLGMEAKTRIDLMVINDDPDEEFEDMAEAVNSEIADVCRISGTDKARSDAYAGQLKVGLGLVGVRRNILTNKGSSLALTHHREFDKQGAS